MKMTCATCKYNYINFCRNIKSYYAYRAISKDKCCEFYELKDRRMKQWRQK